MMLLKGNRLRGLVVGWLLLAAALPARAFNLDDVASKAQALAQEPFQDPRGQVPEWLLKISYDQWRDIRFRADRALWKGLAVPYQVQFFHPGLYYDRPVSINVVDGDSVQRLTFSPSDFDYGANDFASKVPQTLGYAGFRVHAPLKRAEYYDEVIVFLGASYFRAVGAYESFGMSARGLAIDTASSSGEEFPYFREFWLIKPVPWATEMLVYALLDSPSVSGAYRFIVRPGIDTKVDVEARLFLRRAPQKMAVAPLTSMFFHGENTQRPLDDFRPEAHDSDGLLLEFAGGEKLWRPLDNPSALRVSSFKMTNPQGFGLIQRDRNPDHYQDWEAHYERRPSTWLTPRGEWTEGRVELVEIPTKSDSNDNVVAFWVPEAPLTTDKPHVFSYTLSWFGEDRGHFPGGRVASTRRDHAAASDKYRFVVDFEGPELVALPGETVLRGVISIAAGDSAAELLDQQVIKNPFTGGWRLTFQVRPKQAEPIELRAFLDQGGQTLTETWSYVLLP